VPVGVQFHEGRCGDAELIESLGDLDACIHFAAAIEAGASMVRPEWFFKNNVAETMLLFDALVTRGVERVVFSSSATVYDPSAPSPLSEDDPVGPTNPYGQSKLIVEQALQWLCTLGRCRGARLRYFNAAGATNAHPERHQPETHLIPALLDAASSGQPVSLFGDDYDTADGTCIRDYVHVIDLARAHLLALDALERHDDLVVNIGSGVGYSNRAVIAAVESVTGRRLDVRVTPRRAGDQPVTFARIDRARELLNWEPEHSALETIVADAWASRQPTP
jgi:UDP-glucose 4-epimerase